jgi:hypothetical protein
MTVFEPTAIADGVPDMSISRRPGLTARSVLRSIQVRLRIPAVLLVSALVVGRWEVIRNYWDRLTRLGTGVDLSGQAVSGNTEYFCPMDPGVLSNWPGKCGICNMALVRRKRGEAVVLPDGVVARMQISPYRIQLAGIKTATIGYQPLVQTYETAGMVRRERNDLVVPIDIPIRSAPWLVDGQSAEVRGNDMTDQQPVSGRLQISKPNQGQGGEGEVLTAKLVLDDANSRLKPGMLALVTFKSTVSQVEPFRSLPTDPPALKPGEPRQLFACPEHPEVVADEPGRCPHERSELIARQLGDHQRVRWWCPVHPAVTADHPGQTCKECGGMILRPRVVSFQPAGKVLAVPDAAVVDTGLRTVVFVETMPGMYDGVEVVLGPRCGNAYPVVRGVEAGQNVVAAGAFLLDAETRLNPSLAASYFGASARDASVSSALSNTVASRDESRSPLSELSPGDRALAQRQKICPVTKKALGSMGTPARVFVAGRFVFLCCDGCKSTIESDPGKYLAILPAAPGP